jgi:CTP:molybdopterin cytidylyltransferase MocA
VVTLVDTPGIRVAAVRAVAERVREGAPVAIATYNGRRGHPVAFDRGVWPAVAEQAEGDQGARGFLRTHPELVIEVASEGDPGDIDTPADLAAWPDRQA